MSNITITNNASATLQVWNPTYKLDQTFTAASPLVYPAGMVIALNTVSGFYEPYVSAGPNGTGTASALLPFDVDASGGAGDFPISALTTGEVREEKVGVSQAMTTPTPAEIIALQDYGIITRPTNQLGELDNQ